jgi:hypothetical protein
MAETLINYSMVGGSEGKCWVVIQPVFSVAAQTCWFFSCPARKIFPVALGAVAFPPFSPGSMGDSGKNLRMAGNQAWLRLVFRT